MSIFGQFCQKKNLFLPEVPTRRCPGFRIFNRAIFCQTATTQIKPEIFNLYEYFLFCCHLTNFGAYNVQSGLEFGPVPSPLHWVELEARLSRIWHKLSIFLEYFMLHYYKASEPEECLFQTDEKEQQTADSFLYYCFLSWTGWFVQSDDTDMGQVHLFSLK